MGKKSRRNKGGDAGKKKIYSSGNPANMIFYPEEAWVEGTTPSGASLRGVVGHDTMFEVTLLVFENRLVNSWMEKYTSGNDEEVFEEYTPILLAYLDAAKMQNSDESVRVKSTTIRDSEKRLQLQVTLLERRLEVKGEESFLFIPLEAFYCNIPHELIEKILGKFGVPPKMMETVMSGYYNVTIRTHKEALIWRVNDRVKPEDDALVGPHPFTRGLRLQSGMTAPIATLLVYVLLKSTGVSPSEVFIFPHGLVFASTDADDKFEKVINKIGSLTPSIYQRSEELWCTAGKHTTAKPMTFALPWDGEHNSPVMMQPGEEPVRNVGKEQFMKNVEENGCSWYPLFSVNPSSTLMMPDVNNYSNP